MSDQWECGPHANAWGGHDARCRKVPATPPADDASEGSVLRSDWERDHDLGHPSLVDCNGDALGPGETCGRPTPAASTDASEGLSEAEREALDRAVTSDLPCINAQRVAEQIKSAAATRARAEGAAEALREAARDVYYESGVQWGRPDWQKWLRDRADRMVTRES